MIRHHVSTEKLSSRGFDAFRRELQTLCEKYRVSVEATHNGLYIEATLSDKPGCPGLVNGDL